VKIAEELRPIFGFRSLEDLRSKARELREDYFEALRYKGEEHPELTQSWFLDVEDRVIEVE
jgi:hypothetical protein